MNPQDIRWQQRFSNFEKAILLLDKTVQMEVITDIERAGMIQFFEVAFELAWKTLKDYLEAQGFQLTSPRDTIKTALQAGLINDGYGWMDALEDRNLTTHTYDEVTSLKVESLIRTKYFPLLDELYQTLKNKI